MTEPIIVHQECFDTACDVIEGKQRFEHNLMSLFVSLAHRILESVEIKTHILNHDTLDTGLPMRIDIEMTKDLWDYYLTAKVYSNYTESE